MSYTNPNVNPPLNQSSQPSITTSTMSYTNPNVNPPINRTPTIEIVVDCDSERPRSSAQQKSGRQGRRTNNHRPVSGKVPITTQSTTHHGSAVHRPSSRWCYDASDERLAEKYYELRRLILNKLDLRALTPQVHLSSLLFNRLCRTLQCTGVWELVDLWGWNIETEK